MDANERKERIVESIKTQVLLKVIQEISDEISRGLSNVTRDAAIVSMLANDTQEEAVLAFNRFLDALVTDLRVNGHGFINDNFKQMNGKLDELAIKSSAPAVEMLEAIERAKANI